MLLFIVSILIIEAESFHIPSKRHRRQSDQPSSSVNPWSNYGNNPQDWPFASRFNTGLDVIAKPVVTSEGHLDIKDWKKLGSLWDMKGNLTGGSNHIWYNYGHLIQPVNRYNVSPTELDSMIQSQQFQDERARSPSLPVATLPGGWTPSECKPPLCNPFVHSVATDTQVMPASGGFVQGALDFPLPPGRDGQSHRFPLSGNYFSGNQPINVQYGQIINPVNPLRNKNKNGSGNSGGSGLIMPNRNEGQRIQPSSGRIPPNTPILELPPGYTA